MEQAAIGKTLAESFEHIGSPQGVLVALSGGADSVALFRLLEALRAEKSFRLYCVHVHHGLRAESDEEEAFVRNLCTAYRVPLQVYHIVVKSGANVEAAARDARYDAFDKSMTAFGADVLALGHHLDDQAENMLIRLLHGAGTRGLSGMRVLSGKRWRPMLTLRATALQAYLDAIGQQFCVDKSNADERFRRNAVRARLIPLMEALAPGASVNLARTADILAAEEDDGNARAAVWLKENASMLPPWLRADEAAHLGVALQRRVLRAYFDAQGIPLDYAQVERVRAMVNSPLRAIDNLPGGCRIMRSGPHLHLLCQQVSLLPLGYTEVIDVDACQTRKIQSFDAEKLEGAELRYRREGDIIIPLGAGGSQKLGEYLINRKAAMPLRAHWPLLVKGSRVLWVPGIGMAQDAAICASTRMIKTLHYVGRLPDEPEQQ